MQVIPISDTEDEPDRHSSVHASILVVARPDRSSKEEEEEMALNRGNKGLRELLVGRNTGQHPKKSPNLNFLLPYPLLPFYPH